MNCQFCTDTDIRPNEGPAKDEAPYVHHDGFIRCFRGETIATPSKEA